MKFEALILRLLCAGSLLVCVVASGSMLLTGPAQVPAINTSTLAGTTHCTAPVRVLPGQVVGDKVDHS